MISTFKNPIPGGFLITAYYRQADKPIIYHKLTADETRADNLIKQIKKDVLREKLTKFLNHRKTIMQNHGGFATPNKYDAIETIKNNLAFHEKNSLEANCKLVINYEELLKSLIPGQTSTFHQSAVETITEILSFCSLELKINL